jgi:hypothetical protein
VSDLTSYTGMKDWLLMLLVGAAGGLVSLLRRTDLATLERLSAAQNQLLLQRIERLERDVMELKRQLDDHLP